MYSQEISILVVEDNEKIRNEIEEFLYTCSFSHIYIAANGLEGWQQYQENNPDIVLTDLTMPLMNGLEMSAKIKSHNNETPILLITSLFEKEITESAVDIGIDGYLFKPISLQRLELILKNFRNRIVLKRKFLNERKLLEEYKGALDASASVTKTDAMGTIIYVNDAFCKMSGYSREELIGQKHSIIKHPSTPQSFYKEMWDILSVKKVWHNRISNLHKDGTTYYEDVVIVPILDQDEEIVEYISIRQDITDLYHQEQYLKKRIQEEVDKNIHFREQQEEKNLLEAKFSIIGKMAAGITHEINTPLTYIKGNLEMMIQDIESLSQDIKQKAYLYEDITTVLNGVNRIASIVESMREITSQKQELAEEKNVYSALIIALTLAHNKAKQIANIRIQNETFKIGMKKERFKYMAMIQEQRIEQVFVIIINNALDALKHIQDFDKRVLEITIENENGFIVVRFQDNGGGIDEDILPKIFDPFESTKVEGGMGIGLNIAKGIVYDHGGKIVPSNHNGGALFEVYLPKQTLRINI